MERDIGQKMALVKLFWFWGYVPDIDVKLVHPEGTAMTKMELTDIDVLGFKIDRELRPQRVAGDCKTKKKESPINRAFWLTGVMHNLGVNRGLVLVSREVQADHKVAARQLGISLLSDEDYSELIRVLLPPNFPHNMQLFSSNTWLKFLAASQAQTSVRGLWDYRRNRYWQDPPQSALRYSLMETRQHRNALAQKNHLLTNIFLDAMTAFAIAFSHMLAELFQVYLVGKTRDELDQQLKTYVYGGRAAYDQLNALTMRVLQLKRHITDPKSTPQPPASLDVLVLPEWPRFLELFRAALDAPSDFFGVPRVLRYLLFEHFLSETPTVSAADAIPGLTTRTLKFSLDVLNYFSSATLAPTHLVEAVQARLDDILIDMHGAEGPKAES